MKQKARRSGGLLGSNSQNAPLLFLRNACPLCYCEDCILTASTDLSTAPLTFPRIPPSTWPGLFTLPGAASNAASASGLPGRYSLGKLNRKLAHTVREEYGLNRGWIRAEPFQASYKPEDPGIYFVEVGESKMSAMLLHKDKWSGLPEGFPAKTSGRRPRGRIKKRARWRGDAVQLDAKTPRFPRRCFSPDGDALPLSEAGRPGVSRPR